MANSWDLLFGSQFAQNTVLASPNGSAGGLTPRALVAADIPNLPASIITSGTLALARGGTNADLSASGSTTAFLAQDASHVISARAIIAADVPNLPASIITSGTLALARGGTNADLSASGAATAFLAQDASHVITARIIAAADGATFKSSTGDGDCFYSLGCKELEAVGGTATAISPTGANAVLCYMFTLNERISVLKIGFSKGSTVVAGATANFGIYDSSKNLLIDSGQFDCSAGGAATQSKTLGAAVTLNPGIYWYVQAATDSTVTSAANILSNNAGAVLRNINMVRQGQSANALSAGALPSSLGVITGFTNRAACAVIFES